MDDKKVKGELAKILSDALQKSCVVQRQSAKLTKSGQGKISQWKNGNISDTSVWKLIKNLNLVGFDVEINVRKSVESVGETKVTLNNIKLR